MFNSLRGLFSSSIQRFINVSKGYNDSNEVSKIFSMGLNIHIVVGIILAILLEIVGFILIPRLEIANGNYNAAYWILQWSILSTVFSLLQYSPLSHIIQIHQFLNILTILLKHTTLL